jgi:hypothetical protein
LILPKYRIADFVVEAVKYQSFFKIIIGEGSLHISFGQTEAHSVWILRSSKSPKIIDENDILTIKNYV